MLHALVAKPRLARHRKVRAQWLQMQALEDRLVCAGDFHSAPVVPLIDPAMKPQLQSVYRLGKTNAG